MSKQRNTTDWEQRRTRLRGDLERCLGLRRLGSEFIARRSTHVEEVEPAVAEALRLWPALARYRAVPAAAGERSFTAERVSFPGVEGDVVGMLRIPAGLDGPAPAVLCLHGHARGLLLGKEMTEFYAVPLTQAGFVTFSPDAMLFGERRRREFDSQEIGSGGQSLFLAEKMAAFEAFLHGSTLLGLQLAEYMRCLDFLAGLPEVCGVAVMGHSMGGIYSFWLSALDERVDAAVCLAGLLSYRLMAEAGVSRYHGIYCLVPGLLTLCDTPEIVSLIAPRAFYALHARGDLGFPIQGVEEISEAALWAYSRYRADGQCVATEGDQGNRPHRFLSRIIDGDHGDVLAAPQLDEAFHWLRECMRGPRR